MTHCSNCGENIPNQKLECPYCGSPVSPQKEKIIKEIENQGEKRKRAIATFLLSMFAMWIIPSPKIILFLAIISFGILPVLIIYHTWKKKQAENKLENSTKNKMRK